MYHYRNKKTGAVIKSACKVTGNNWDLMDDGKCPVATYAEDDMDKNIVEQVEDTAGEAGPAAPKPTRKGKK